MANACAHERALRFTNGTIMINYRLSVAIFAVAILIVGFANIIELQWKWVITGGWIVAGLIFSRYEAPDGMDGRVLLGVLVDSRNKLSSSRGRF